MTKIEKLESVRGFAAIYVMLSHLSSNYLHWQGRLIGQPFRFAQEGVLLFFLLSGFVIYYSWEEHPGPKNFAVFFYKRFRRIYPIFVGVLLLSYVIVCCMHGWQSIQWKSFLGNIFMLQGFDHDPGWKAMAYMGNGPLWSLSYEWWFYMMFYPLYVFVPPRWRMAGVFGLALLGIAGEAAAPTLFFHILAAFPLWWCGVEFAREYVESGTFTLGRQKWTLSVLIIIGLIYAWMVKDWADHGGKLDVLEYPLVKLRHFAVAMILVAFFFIWKKFSFIGFRFTFGPCKIFAGMSYAIYLFHYPIICYLEIFRAPSLMVLNIICKLALVLVLAYLAEEVGQRWVNRWMDRWFAIKPRVVEAPAK